MASLKSPRVALCSNSRSVLRRRDIELDWSRVIQEADDVVGCCRNVNRDIAEPPVMIADPVPEVGTDGGGGSVEAVGPVLVREEAVT